MTSAYTRTSTKTLTCLELHAINGDKFHKKQELGMTLSVTRRLQALPQMAAWTLRRPCSAPTSRSRWKRLRKEHASFLNSSKEPAGDNIPRVSWWCLSANSHRSCQQSTDSLAGDTVTPAAPSPAWMRGVDSVGRRTDRDSLWLGLGSGLDR